jgi:cytochrome P450
LARLEGEVAFRDLTTRVPSLALDGAPIRRRTDLLRGYERVPVAVR